MLAPKNRFKLGLLFDRHERHLFKHSVIRKLRLRHLKHWFSCLKVGQKISLGYGLALGVAILGTTTGISIADQYHKEAVKHEQDAIEEAQSISELEIQLLQVLLHQQQILMLLENRDLLEQQYSYFLTHVDLFKKEWSEFKSSEGDTKNPKVEESPAEIETVRRFLQANEEIPEAYLQQTEAILKAINAAELSPAEIQIFRSQLLTFGSSPASLQLKKFLQDLEQLKVRAYKEYTEAKTEFANVQVLRVQVIAGTLTLSVAIAILLAIYTSRAIARPLQQVTNIAQEATQTGNFDLQAAVTTKDEISILATALNQLIRRVKQLLQEQQAASTERLIQHEKMATLGQLIAGVTHDINNPINSIAGNLTHTDRYLKDLLEHLHIYQQHYPEPASEIVEHAEAIELEFVEEDLPLMLASLQQSAERIRDISYSMRLFARADSSQKIAFDIHEGINSTLLILKHRLKANNNHREITVSKNYGQFPKIKCFPGQLNQVFMNLIGNSIDALEDARDQSKNSDDSELAPMPSIQIQTEIIEDNWVRIRIADNGSGIDEALKLRLFESFFTTKDAGKGTGLGLSMSHQIVTQKHGGKLYCNSQPGQGAEFVIELPIG
ncbi:MAG: sensor histidine kinase [Oscillatoriales cyanobacterium]|nr:MAG: sensor histidine kinase [Oscillatoriales cyanobacterium]TAE94262.1 MAG: sensor histidine kinase [Oscillatoriales cyanobacterium]TAF22754.1 MAG: sensor histidine kinase [Oscillatoriales cyanobacterium]TAF26175.1 MAG: sensor histidine kinase [Oscillatoriales cyanobacterium]